MKKRERRKRKEGKRSIFCSPENEPLMLSREESVQEHAVAHINGYKRYCCTIERTLMEKNVI